MNGDKFKSLEVKEQVNYVNELLKKGDTVDNIRLTLGIGKNYIGNTFKANGYIKDNISKLYILDTKNTSNTINTNTTNNTYNTNSTSNTCNTNYKYQDIKALENRLNSLEKEFEKLKLIVNSKTNADSNTITTRNTYNTCNSKEIIKYKSSNLVSRNYKIDKEVLEQFVEFCKVNKLKYNHNVSDLITNAILEYMNKNK
jgi:hypothetical protein